MPSYPLTIKDVTKVILQPPVVELSLWGSLRKNVENYVRKKWSPSISHLIGYVSLLVAGLQSNLTS